MYIYIYMMECAYREHKGHSDLGVGAMPELTVWFFAREVNKI